MDADPGGRDGAIHGWFGLTYANYLVLRRSLLQSMPLEWQDRFVGCLEELSDAFRHLDAPERYAVQVRGKGGRFAGDPIPHYSRGRTRVDRCPPEPNDDPPCSGSGYAHKAHGRCKGYTYDRT